MEDPDEAWIDGEVVSVNGENVKVLCTSGKTVSSSLDFIISKCLFLEKFLIMIFGSRHVPFTFAFKTLLLVIYSFYLYHCLAFSYTKTANSSVSLDNQLVCSQLTNFRILF